MGCGCINKGLSTYDRIKELAKRLKITRDTIYKLKNAVRLYAKTQFESGVDLICLLPEYRISAKTGFNDMEEKANLYRKFCNTQIQLYKKWLNKEFVIVDENLKPIDVKLNEIKFSTIDNNQYPQKPFFDPQTNFIHEIAYTNYNLFISNIKDKKNSIIKESNKEIELFKRFQTAVQINPNLTYSEFINSIKQ